jgi:small subunit ribosomal protein S2
VEADPGAAAEPTFAERERRIANIRSLLEAGAHFGHQCRRWNPKMKPFIFGARDGIHIVDLDQTLPRLREGLDFVREVVADGGKVLVVGTKRQAQAPVQLEAQRANQFYVNNRWLGGMLTNFRTVKKSIERFKEQLATLADEERVAELSKKELSRLNRSVTKYQKSLDGLREMTRLPDAMFVIDVNKEHLAISEAQRLGIPIVAVVDTNCSPDGIDHVIPANDDAIRAIQLYCELVADACLEGAEIFNERAQGQDAASGAAPEAEGTPGGRRVVEIKPAVTVRRGRQPGGTHSATPRRGRGAEPAADAAAATAAADAAPEADAAPAAPKPDAAKPAAAAPAADEGAASAETPEAAPADAPEGESA